MSEFWRALTSALGPWRSEVTVVVDIRAAPKEATAAEIDAAEYKQVKSLGAQSGPSQPPSPGHTFG